MENGYTMNTGKRPGIPKNNFGITASPFKFPGDVLKAIKDMEYIQGKDDFQVLEGFGVCIRDEDTTGPYGFKVQTYFAPNYT